ncbi:unnamed protein product [Darwinula stevensoni]|uniref:Uncharacterized protein n=1 Tax=Darwinula stevensoni TaxID=69355 RepID=A0A7R8ZXF4_9CRUS|nr:unnamed protein product [Darwinula stevensoni]CAG0878516.1 unnamed protein product [Darwinula stevensoni]
MSANRRPPQFVALCGGTARTPLVTAPLGRCQPRLSRLILEEILVRLLDFVAGFWVSGAGVEDEMHSDSLQWIIDGFSEPDSGVEFLEGNGNGADSADRFLVLAAVIQSRHANDSRRSYQALKFLAVGWLRRKMADHEQWTAEVDTSNEDTSVSLAFQQTMSAQDTLAEAKALFTEFEVGEMEIEEEEGP